MEKLALNSLFFFFFSVCVYIYILYLNRESERVVGEANR